MTVRNYTGILNYKIIANIKQSGVYLNSTMRLKNGKYLNVLINVEILDESVENFNSRVINHRTIGLQIYRLSLYLR